jgi:Domain of unknown function (DUF4350)
VTGTAAAGTFAEAGVATPSLRQRLRGDRGLVAVVVIVLLAAVVMAVVQSRRTAGFLDPDAVDPTGSHALATLLHDQGVEVVRVTRADDAARAIRPGSTTLLVAPTAPLSSRMLDAVRRTQPGVVVLVTPDDASLAAWVTGARATGISTSTDEIAPDCLWQVATRAGALPAAGVQYATGLAEARTCWDHLVLDVPDTVPGSSAVTVIGTSDPFTNAHLADSGYAALAMGALGRGSTLVWWLPSAADPLQAAEGEQPSLGDLVPTWVHWALLQIVIAVLVIVWWRGRRLGRVVVEPLPVVVRATETVEGRARLYRRGRARGRAADELRAATTSRIRGRLALPLTAEVDTIATAAAARTGRPTSEVARLLGPGSEPSDDASLTGLADTLDTLENEVRRS